MSKNPMTSMGISNLFKQQLASDKFIDSPLILLNLNSYWVNKETIEILDRLRETKSNLNVLLAGILSNWETIEPNAQELYFKIANHEAMDHKKASDRRDFGHFVLSLSDTNITKGCFFFFFF